MSKGQVFTADLVASIAVFSFFLVLFGVLWNVAVEDVEERGNLREAKGKHTFNLLKSEGSPSNWNSSTVEAPGIYEDGILDRGRFMRLENLSSRKLTNLLRSQEYRIEVEYLNGTSLSEGG